MDANTQSLQDRSFKVDQAMKLRQSNANNDHAKSQSSEDGDGLNQGVSSQQDLTVEKETKFDFEFSRYLKTDINEVRKMSMPQILDQMNRNEARNSIIKLSQL